MKKLGRPKLFEDSHTLNVKITKEMFERLKIRAMQFPQGRVDVSVVARIALGAYLDSCERKSRKKV